MFSEAFRSLSSLVSQTGQSISGNQNYFDLMQMHHFQLLDNRPLHYKRIQNKIYTFKNPKTRKTPLPIWYLNPTPKQITKSISTKAHTFQKRMAFNYKDVHKKYGDHFPCALTGRPLKFNEPHTYEYDHIMPHSRGGDNSLSNLQILCPEANQAKGMMTDDEFKDLCKEVIIHAGYKIYKPLDT